MNFYKFLLIFFIVATSGCKTNQCDLDEKLIESLERRYARTRSDLDCKLLKEQISNYLDIDCLSNAEYLQSLRNNLDCGIYDIPPCANGVKDGDETGIDCGGTCAPCIVPPSCSDQIQNGNETGIDCGGSCKPCVSCTNGVQDGQESGVDCGGPDCVECDD